MIFGRVWKDLGGVGMNGKGCGGVRRGGLELLSSLFIVSRWFLIVFIFSFLLIFILKTIMLSITGLYFITAISGAASAISNVGPGLGDVIGPNGNYSSLPSVSKFILAFAMLLGRLELFAVLVLFLPSFWRD